MGTKISSTGDLYTKERYEELVRAFLKLDEKIEALKKDGLTLKHDILRAIDKQKKKKITDFINKL